jgi:hypothetical protein
MCQQPQKRPCQKPDPDYSFEVHDIRMAQSSYRVVNKMLNCSKFCATCRLSSFVENARIVTIS